MLYNWLRTRRQTAPIQLPAEPSGKQESEALPLTGWKVLLLWIPAACDLTGTTVRILFTICCILSYKGAIVDERWIALHSRINLPNDSRCSRFVRGYIQCPFLAPQTLALSVRDVFFA